MEVLSSSFFANLSPLSYPSSSDKLLPTKLYGWGQAYVSLFPVKRAYFSLSRQIGCLVHKENRFQVFCSEKREISFVDAGRIVGLAGPPGAGKSTLASEVAQRVNKLWPQKCFSISIDSQVEPSEVATVLPMDGFHLYRHQLDAMEDPEEAHARRGAPWTFNPELLLRCLKTLRNQGSVYAPSFDHGIGDPVEDDIFVDVSHKVVIVEGNYLLLEEGAWREISTIFDEKWFIDVDMEKAMERALKRHMSTGKLHEVAKWRIDYNDRPNAELIMKSKKNADLVIKSIDISR